MTAPSKPPRVHHSRVNRLERMRTSDGQTLNFMIPGIDRQHLARFLSPEEVPDFEGDVAWFLMDWVRKGPWMGWRIVRQVEPPPGEA